MNDNELKALFDQMAPGYDKQWERTAPINQCLYFLLESVFAALPEDARILCVGAGTGSEILHLASRFPGWRFTAVEPARGMLDVCRRRADEAGIAERCEFHEGYLDSLPAGASYQAATSFRRDPDPAAATQASLMSGCARMADSIAPNSIRCPPIFTWASGLQRPANSSRPSGSHRTRPPVR